MWDEGEDAGVELCADEWGMIHLSGDEFGGRYKHRELLGVHMGFHKERPSYRVMGTDYEDLSFWFSDAVVCGVGRRN